MGQKTHPYGFRLGIVKPWRSRYYARRNFPELLKEDELIRRYLKTRLVHAAISDVHIERKPGKVTVTVHTGRPGVVIGLSGNSRIHTLPPRFISRVSATRDASICRLVIQPGSSAISPKWPNATVLPRVASPLVRPLNRLRNLTRLGASIAQVPVE